MKMHKVFAWLLSLSIFLFFSCNSFKSNSQDTDTGIHKIAESIAPGSFQKASGIVFDSSAIEKFLADKPLFKEFKSEFDTFYHANNYNYAWFDKNGLIETSSELISSIQNVEQEGVTAAIPYKDSLEQLLHNATGTGSTVKPDINIELMLTGEYFYYAKKIYTGSLSSEAQSINWYLPRKKLSYAALLENNLNKK